MCRLLLAGAHRASPAAAAASVFHRRLCEGARWSPRRSARSLNGPANLYSSCASPNLCSPTPLDLLVDAQPGVPVVGVRVLRVLRLARHIIINKTSYGRQDVIRWIRIDHDDGPYRDPGPEFFMRTQPARQDLHQSCMCRTGPKIHGVARLVVPDVR